MNPRDGRLYFGMGTATNSGVVGTDSNDLMFGIPAFSVPQVMPGTPLPSSVRFEIVVPAAQSPRVMAFVVHLLAAVSVIEGEAQFHQLRYYASLSGLNPNTVDYRIRRVASFRRSFQSGLAGSIEPRSE